MIKRLPANTRGRDFVCGDIHGSYSCVEAFLRGVSFDKNIDRLICAGDLVDRGPENEKCVELLYEPWFHATKGNHEELMEEFFKDEYPGSQWWTPNGGMWGVAYKRDNSDMGILIRGAIEDVVSKLPYLITVEKPDGSLYHVLHAELDSVEQLTDADLADPVRFKDVSSRYTSDGHVITWGRYIFARMYKKLLDDREVEKIKRWVELEKPHKHFGPNLGMIYSGHTPVRQSVQFYGQTNLDTMAFGSYKTDAQGWEGLTIAEPLTGKFWFANDREFKQVEPIIIN
jgi:hypothetical protein